MESARSRKLLDPESKNTWSSECIENRVLIRAGKSGAEKESEKSFADNSAALSYAEKEEWARLKKGFVLDSAGAAPGEPRMHRYLGRGATGAMVAESLGDGNYIFNQFDESVERDKIFILGEDACIKTVLPLPERNSLLWAARYCTEQQILLLLVDHQIFSYSIPNQSFEKLCERNKIPASFLSLRGTLAAWYAEPEIVLQDLNTARTVQRINITPEKYSNHSLQLKAELSPDGQTLACCSRTKEISLFDVESGKQITMINGKFEKAKKLAFSADGRYLLVLEEYGSWGLHCFDLLERNERKDWIELNGLNNADIAVDESGRLAVSKNQWIEIYDLATTASVTTFRADHVVKSCAISFRGNSLSVKADSGCASIYSLR
ncbi:MAG: WD40 repeat domain-containing protein [Candidatus Obscuribacterales bacterium]|nr:WD40 repeat domain-containing protein [Candidatus Obscuribacterales bacterium]